MNFSFCHYEMSLFISCNTLCPEVLSDINMVMSAFLCLLFDVLSFSILLLSTNVSHIFYSWVFFYLVQKSVPFNWCVSPFIFSVIIDNIGFKPICFPFVPFGFCSCPFPALFWINCLF